MSAEALDRIKAIAQYVNPHIAAFSADTSIASRFQGRSLKRFWRDCQAHSDGRLPDLKMRPGTAIYQQHLKPLRIPVIAMGTLLWLTQIPVADPAFLYMYVAICISLFVTVAWYGLCAFVVLALNLSHSGRHSIDGLLPNGITTFGMLADLMEGVRGGWCHACGYDLTGLESDKCPECGTVRNPRHR